MTIEKVINNGVEGYEVIDDNGNIYFIIAKNEIEAQQKVENIIAHLTNAKTSYKELRRQEYPSTDELIVALWEKIVEKKEDGVIELENKRLAIKEKYPKG